MMKTTDEQISALRTEASEAGDGEQVVICERALATDEEWDTQASAAAAALGRRGRAANTPAQQEAARANGAKGGRPTRLGEYEARIADLLGIEDRDERASALHLAAKEIAGVAWSPGRREEANRLVATIRAQIPADADLLRGMDLLAARGAIEATARD